MNTGYGNQWQQERKLNMVDNQKWTIFVKDHFFAFLLILSQDAWTNALHKLYST